MQPSAALAVGIAGGSFGVGIAYISRWFPAENQGTALGIFRVGNIGAAVTKLLALLVLVAWGWEAVGPIRSLAIAVMAIVFMAGDDPVLRQCREGGEKPRSAWLEIAPLGDDLCRRVTKSNDIMRPYKRCPLLWCPALEIREAYLAKTAAT